MRLDFLGRLASPCCSARMRFAALARLPVGEDPEIEEGSLACEACGRGYPILKGVPRLLAGGGQGALERTAASFAWEWTRYPGSLPEDERVFLEETQIPLSEFQGRLVLDAGCGMGRYALAALSLGAEVVALDLSESLLRLAAPAPRRPKLHLVQGDLLRPPLRRELFDIAYSQGVLHHTPDTREAFLRLSELVKPGGLLSVWVYGKAGRFSEFATNPLRGDRAWVGRRRRLAWAIVALRSLVSGALRLLTTRLPLGLTYALCYPLALLGAVPGLGYLTFSVHPRFRVRLLENFDWLSPPFQHHHTKEELSSWFEEAGFEILGVLPHGLVPKPGILGRKKHV